MYLDRNCGLRLPLSKLLSPNLAKSGLSDSLSEITLLFDFKCGIRRNFSSAKG